MCSSISTTENILLPYIRSLTKDSNFIKREVASRFLAITTIFFRTVDTLSNFSIGLSKLIGRAINVIGIKISPNLTSNESIQCSFKGARDGVFKDPLLIFKLIYSPNSTVAMAPNQQNPTTFFQRALAQYELDTYSSNELDANWNLNRYFGHIYVINLDDRPTSADPTKFKRRLDRIAADLNKVGCQSFERFRATYGAHELTSDIWNRVDDNSWGKNGEELDRQHMGQAGCFMSHYRVIKDANEKYITAQKDLEKANTLLQNAHTNSEVIYAKGAIKIAEAKIKEYSSILILEDDNGFGFVKKPKKWVTNFLQGNNSNIFNRWKRSLAQHFEKLATISMEGAGTYFRKVMQELPRNWDMLYLLTVECGKDGKGWLKAKSPVYSDHLNRLERGLLTNAIAINSRAYSTILKELEKINDPTAMFKPVDHAYADLHSRPDFLTLTPKIPLAYQAPGESAITGTSGGEPWDGTWDRGF